MRINHTKATLKNVRISDALSGGAGDETYIEDTFKLSRVELSPKGDLGPELEKIDLGGKLELSADKRSFTINLGNIDGGQYWLTYNSTYKPGSVLRNSASLTSTNGEWKSASAYQSAESGGTAEGDLASRSSSSRWTPLMRRSF